MPILEPRLTVVHAALDAVSNAFAQAEVVFDDTKQRDRDPHAFRAALLASPDPLTRARAPPANETPVQRAARQAAEMDAKRISDMIDVELARQRAVEAKGRKPVKILLLGQSESGKSTTLKNFQLINSPRAFREERLSWRAVVQLNVVRSVRLVLDAIADAAIAQGLPLDSSPVPPTTTTTFTTGTPTNTSTTPSNANAFSTPISPISPSSPSSLSTSTPTRPAAEEDDPENATLTPTHVALRARLLPLLRAEHVLLTRLMPAAAAAGASLREIEISHPTSGHHGHGHGLEHGVGAGHGVGLGAGLGQGHGYGQGLGLGSDTLPTPVTPSSASSKERENVVGEDALAGSGSGAGAASASAYPSANANANVNGIGSGAGAGTGVSVGTPGTGGREVSVFAGSAWKTAFARVLSATGNGNGNGRVGGQKGGIGEDGIDWTDLQDPTRVLHACGQDLVTLYADPRVRALLRRKRIRLEEMPGFFLDSLERITKIDYLPSDDDILRARLKTLGVTEYRFTMRAGQAVGHDWRVYDVGGQRSLRAAWVPFFDDMSAIIFLAPISCFDQVLVEDVTVNRLEDSVLLWKSVISNQLLAKTNIVLFLNKCDVLRAKLRAGIRLGKYVISYGDRPNDFEHASDYLRRKFYNIHHDHSPEPRQFYSHFTSVTDTKATSIILGNVSEMVLRENLKVSKLIA